MIPEITLVIGIDAKTIQQLRISWPTWRLNRNAMWDWPIVVFYDRDQLDRDRDVVPLVDGQMRWRGDVTLVPWPPFGDNPVYESQRDRMLAGHVLAPAVHVRTPWYCKLDCDAVARPHDRWFSQSWLEPNEQGQPPVYVCSRWRYSKGIDFLGRLEDWGDQILMPSEPLGVRSWPNYSPTALRVGHARMCSWIGFFRKEFATLTAMACLQTHGMGRIPIPSEDTLHWFVAARLKLFHRIANFKAVGWSNHPKLHNLKKAAAEIMAAGAVNA